MMSPSLQHQQTPLQSWGAGRSGTRSPTWETLLTQQQQSPFQQSCHCSGSSRRCCCGASHPPCHGLCSRGPGALGMWWQQQQYQRQQQVGRLYRGWWVAAGACRRQL